MSDSLGGLGPDLEDEGSAIPAQVRDPIGVLRRGWKWGLAAFLVLVIPASFGAFLVPLHYEAASRMMLTGKAIPDKFVPDTIVATGSEQFQAIENRVLTRARLSKLVASDAFVDDRATKPVPQIVEELRRDLKLEKTTISDSRGLPSSIEVRVSLQGERPEQIAKIVNALTDEFVNEHLQYRGQQSQVTLDFMRREFERADEALREHQRKLALFRDENRGSLPEEQEATIAKLERLENQRRSIILQLNDGRRQMAGLSTASSPVRGQPTTRDQMLAEYERLRTVYTDEHPQVVAMKRRLAAFDEEDVDPSGTSPRSGARMRLEAEIEQRQSRLGEIDVEVSRLEEQISRTSGITEEYRALERKEGILEENYEEYLRKLKEAELSRSMELSQQGAQLVRLEAAVVPTRPVIPRLVFVLGAVVLTLAGALAVVVLHELLNPVVIDAEHLQRLSSLPTLGSIPPVA